MAILLMPERAIDFIAIQQFLMAPQIVDLALVKHQDRIRLHQGGQAGAR